MQDLIFGKLNTVIYSTGEVSIYGTIQLTKLLEWAESNKESIFTDSNRNQHLRFVSRKLKQPFEKYTHILTTNLEFSNSQISHTPITSKSDEKDDLPF